MGTPWHSSGDDTVRTISEVEQVLRGKTEGTMDNNKKGEERKRRGRWTCDAAKSLQVKNP